MGCQTLDIISTVKTDPHLSDEPLSSCRLQILVMPAIEQRTIVRIAFSNEPRIDEKICVRTQTISLPKVSFDFGRQIIRKFRSKEERLPLVAF